MSRQARQTTDPSNRPNKSSLSTQPLPTEYNPTRWNPQLNPTPSNRTQSYTKLPNEVWDQTNLIKSKLFAPSAAILHDNILGTMNRRLDEIAIVIVIAMRALRMLVTVLVVRLLIEMSVAVDIAVAGVC